MKKFLLVSAYLFLSAFVSTFAQYKVVILGSSTAYGSGASTYNLSWAGLLTDYLNRNTSDGIDTSVVNLAAIGYDSYLEMPDNFVPPAGRPYPDDSHNITKALSYNPDIIIINLPSNDVGAGYSRSETMFNLRTMSSLAFANGAKCFVTTTQPRNDYSQALRDTLYSLVDSINNAFGAYAIDFWSPIVSNDGTNRLNEIYRDPNSNVHVNDAGHEKLFLAVRGSYFFVAGPVNLSLMNFSGRTAGSGVQLNWHTEQQYENTTFTIERSSDGITFIPLSHITEASFRSAADYSYSDATPLMGNNYYRLTMSQPGKQSYSNILRIKREQAPLAVDGWYISGNRLTATVSALKNQQVTVSVIQNNGAVVYKQPFTITIPSTVISVPVNQISAGTYFLRVTSADGRNVVVPIMK